MGQKYIAAVAQYDVPERVVDSTAKLDDVAARAAGRRAELLVVPETAIGELANTKTTAADHLPDVQKIARQRGIAIAVSFYSKDTDRYFNQGYIVSRTGTVVHAHRKIYLAPPERDQDGISPGNDVSVSTSELGRVGMLICKDGFNRYAHFLYDKLYTLGAEVICVPTWSISWPGHDTEEYIKALYTYGAFASRAYVLVAGNLNQETNSFGRSLVVSPLRGVLQEGSRDKEELLLQTVDLHEVEQARQFDMQWQPPTRLV